MPSSPSPPPVPDPSPPSSGAAPPQVVDSPGAVVGDGKGRVFPCEGCGADLTFHIGQQRLVCPFCGYQKEIELAPSAEIVEKDFNETLDRLRRLKKAKKEAEAKAAASHPGLPEDGPPPTLSTDPTALHEVRCGGCGGTVEFLGSLTSTECPYCATPLQRENVHDAPDRIPADGVMPFLVDRERAKVELTAWVNSRWFAPNAFRRRGVNGKFSGVYLPYWTFDALTWTQYAGQRGDHYYVEVRDGNETKRERRTAWTSVTGDFQQFFDDVLVLASDGLPIPLVQELEPWPLERCVPFNQQMLAGYLARTYETELEDGFSHARQRMEAALEQEVKRLIGGNEQRIDSMKANYGAVTFKHLLLPVWMLAYRYHDKAYQVLINAATGEVQGERPWSWIKITLAAVSAVAALIALFVLFRR